MLNSRFEKINGQVMNSRKIAFTGILSRSRFVFREFPLLKGFFACKISDIQVNIFSQRVGNDNF